MLIEILLNVQDDEFINFTDWESFQPILFSKTTRLTHTKHPGKIVVSKCPDHDRLFFANVICEDEPDKAWLIMHAFVGRLADRMHDKLESIHILFQ
jgi:hypothetical protein